MFYCTSNSLAMFQKETADEQFICGKTYLQKQIKNEYGEDIQNEHMIKSDRPQKQNPKPPAVWPVRETDW